MRSAGRGEEQVLSHYYLATLPDPANFRVAEARFDYPGEDLESFRWTPLRSLAESELTFGVDHAALAALRGRIG